MIETMKTNLRFLASLSAPPKGTIYHPKTKRIVAFNFGTSVRPDVAPIAVTPIGTETMASFLARGGRVRVCAPKVAKGAICVSPRVKIAKTCVSRAAGLTRFLYAPKSSNLCSVGTLSRNARPYQHVMKTYGPRG